MAERPSFQFYPGDWMRNASLRRCTPAERGVWIDFMCLAHDSDEYGVIRWPKRDLARALSVRISVIETLIEKRVLKGADKGEICEGYTYTPRHARADGEPVILLEKQEGPIFFCARMVRDEYVRMQRGKGSRYTTKGAPNTSPKYPFGDGSSSSSASTTTKHPADPESIARDQLLPGYDGEPPNWLNVTAWRRFTQYRQRKGIALDSEQAELNLRYLRNLTAEQQQAEIDQAISNGWKGIVRHGGPTSEIDRGSGKQSAVGRARAKAEARRAEREAAHGTRG